MRDPGETVRTGTVGDRPYDRALFDSACPYSDGALCLAFCVCVDHGVNTIVSVIIECKDDYYDALERLNERIAWTFASEHLRNV